MQIVVDQRPSSELSDHEIVAYLFQSLRVNEMKRASQVKNECERLFPDLPADRKRDCLVLLAQKLS